MQIFNDLSEIKKDKNTVLTIGTFDGIHLGHKELIDEVVSDAQRFGGRSFLVTFNPHPRSIVSKDFKLKLLTTLKEKADRLESLGIQNLFILKFTREISQLTAEEFFKKFIVDGIGLREIIIGYNHHFGKGRSGDKNTLDSMGKVFDFDVKAISALQQDDETISSSKVRELLSKGVIKKANDFLGRSYSFGGKVVEGDKRGRTLGFPTANIALDDVNKLLPALGIYLVEFFVKNEKYFGLLSVGQRPTFYESGQVVPEVYVLDFDQDIYGEYVTVKVLERIRGEEKFSSVEDLVLQMNKDKEIGIELISKLAS